MIATITTYYSTLDVELTPLVIDLPSYHSYSSSYYYSSYYYHRPNSGPTNKS